MQKLCTQAQSAIGWLGAGAALVEVVFEYLEQDETFAENIAGLSCGIVSVKGTWKSLSESHGLVSGSSKRLLIARTCLFNMVSIKPHEIQCTACLR